MLKDSELTDALQEFQAVFLKQVKLEMYQYDSKKKVGTGNGPFQLWFYVLSCWREGAGTPIGRMSQSHYRHELGSFFAATLSDVEFRPQGF